MVVLSEQAAPGPAAMGANSKIEPTPSWRIERDHATEDCALTPDGTNSAYRNASASKSKVSAPSKPPNEKRVTVPVSEPAVAVETWLSWISATVVVVTKSCGAPLDAQVS